MSDRDEARIPESDRTTPPSTPNRNPTPDRYSPREQTTPIPSPERAFDLDSPQRATPARRRSSHNTVSLRLPAPSCSNPADRTAPPPTAPMLHCTSETAIRTFLHEYDRYRWACSHRVIGIRECIDDAVFDWIRVQMTQHPSYGNDLNFSIMAFLYNHLIQLQRHRQTR